VQTATAQEAAVVRKNEAGYDHIQIQTFRYREHALLSVAVPTLAMSKVVAAAPQIANQLALPADQALREQHPPTW
jgi:hypothetical protein